MVMPYAQKVDQQCLYLDQVLSVAASNSAGLPGLLQAGYLQFEMAIRYYFYELADKSGRQRVQIGLIDERQIKELHEHAPSPELAEIVGLVQERTSWLATFIEQLEGLRNVEPLTPLKGSIFQLTEQERTDNLISAQDLSSLAPAANLADLKSASDAFKQLLTRQRAAREEY